jgi:transposase
MKVYIGIDWSEHKHDLCILNESGAVLKAWKITHTQRGFAEIPAALQELGLEPQDCYFGIETAYNLIFDFLAGWGYPALYLLPPSAVKASRYRYRQTPARTDQSDAWLIANLLRVDLDQFRCWQPSTSLVMQIRAMVNLVLKLTRQSQRYTNQLRATLLRYYPAALRVFKQLDCPLALQFILSYPDPAAGQALTFLDFETFARKNRFYQTKAITKAYLRLQAPQPDTPNMTTIIYQPIAIQQATLLQQVLAARKATLNRLKQLYSQHPDQQIYASLPGAGDFIEPALLSKLGDQRARFPTAQSLQALAGTCPVTDRSGKSRRILFRTACDHDFRFIAQQWARGSLRKSSWARLYFSQTNHRSGSKSHAFRCLANRWLAILWRLWQDGVPYDETVHLRNRMARAKPLITVS